MSRVIRTATAEEAMRLWPAVSEEHLFADEVAIRAYLDAAPWRLRVTKRGEAALLGVWRERVGALAIRAVWSAQRSVPAFAADALEQARENGLARVLSPLLPEVLLHGYRSAGMRDVHRVVAIQGHPQLVLPADPPIGTLIRAGNAADVPAAAAIEETSFDDFWRYDETELLALLDTDRFAVAETSAGEVIGYTLTTVSRGAATLSRLATAAHARNCGVGRALLAESAAWSAKSGAATYSLCTQEDNSVSRSLYASAGLGELAERYGFALGDVAEEGLG